ncbi:bacterioferritin-associated ferredoxin [Schlesneria sp. T3-172]|uniref:(2Fe-2S)-binding protein n=1 Tax=Schlesneria sphaerica TaxID=3373610 RepID=UPI0037C8B084
MTTLTAIIQQTSTAECGDPDDAGRLMQLDDTICYCFHISKRKILNFIRVHRPRRASQISECGGAGTGCGWCVNYLKRYFAESQQDASNSPGTTEDLTAADYARQRAAYIKAGHGKPAAGAVPLPTDEPPELSAGQQSE